MKTSPNGRALIAKYEGLILQSYDDANDHIVPVGGSSRGTLTIGYGHTSAAGAPKVIPGMRITKEQADAILASDLQKVEADVTRLVKVPLNQNQFDALVSFHFNTGSLGKSTTLRKLNAGDMEGAAAGLMLYTRGRVNGQLIPMKGLVTRRNEEKALFLKKGSVVSVPTGTGTTTGVAIGGGLMYTYWHAFLNHWVLYSLGLVATGIIIDILIHLYKGKQNDISNLEKKLDAKVA